ncbi:MAG: viroplasmin family protein [Cetobacterium sp.]|uniref:ribonuclease H1 domain-containing protein n=1 Tax=Cetobacterium sp. TaxID=2071632 RepID=UPI003F3DE20F
MAKKYYAYFIIEGDVKGIVDDWDKCREIVTGIQARYKGFNTKEEAENWLEKGANYSLKENPKETKNTKIIEGIYFDAGKRGLNGVTYTRVTNQMAEDLIECAVDSIKDFPRTNIALNSLDVRKKLSTFNGNKVIGLDTKASNNSGELLGFIIATELAMLNIKNGSEPSVVLGDSKLVLDYWSKGNFKYTLPTKTKNVINIAIGLRKEAEKLGVTYRHISGDVNPADLGFHKS